MRVLVTGGTGFIGAHSVMALLDKGHYVRLLVRNKQKAISYYKKMGYQFDEFIVGDMCDASLVKEGLKNCDALLHVAGKVGLESKNADDIYNTNIQAIRSVVGTACEENINNIIYVSSLTALFNPEATKIDEQSPLGVAKGAYAKSKRDCDEYVRDLQEKGKPIQITYPSAVIGPDDPGLSEANDGLVTLLKTIVPITSSGIQHIDVRDVAKIHLSLLEQGPPENKEKGRYILGGHYCSWSDYARLLSKVTGRYVYRLPALGSLLRFVGDASDQVSKWIPLDIRVNKASMALVTQWPEADSSYVIEQTGITLTPLTKTLKDTIGSLIKDGHLSARYLKNE